jgi:hypothetical protein
MYQNRPRRCADATVAATVKAMTMATAVRIVDFQSTPVTRAASTTRPTQRLA